MRSESNTMTIAGDAPVTPEPEGAASSAVAIPVVNVEYDADVDTPTTDKPKAAAGSAGTRTPPSTQQQSRGGKRQHIIIGAIVVTVIVITTLCVLLIKPFVEDVFPFPPTVNYATGVSIITDYAVETKVRSRLATTNLTMAVLNGMNCSSVHIVTLQLPLNARVTSLKTMADDGCTTNGEVKEINEARETFVEQTSQGLSSAYVEAKDGFTYTVQVSMVPYGSTKVELVVEQLLQQRRGEIAFEVPLVPNEEVDSLIFDLFVEDVEGNAVGFDLHLNLPEVSSTVNATNGTSHFHLDLHDARQHNIPRVLRGRYAPGAVPENGILHFDGTCFEHYFLPPSLEPMPRNFIFLLDVNDQHRHDDDKFQKTRAALMNFIDTLDEQDTFSIQTFAHQGTMDVWGPNPGTTEEKADAVDYLTSLKPKENEWWNGWGTDLHAAIIEALIRAKTDIKESMSDTVSIIVVISDGYASRGETDPSRIVNNIYGYNKDGSVKIFTLGYQNNADMTLLDAIALMNGGISATILDGGEDFKSQMVKFLESELGSVLLSDMSIEFPEGFKVYGETDTYFPLLAGGYEVVIRGLVEGDLDPATFKTFTSASTLEDVQNWVTIATDSPSTGKSSLCYQSYAHARVAQLVRLRDAADFLDDKILRTIVKLKDPICNEKEFVKCIEEEALELALNANIIAKGLTAMVTVDSDECMKPDEDAEVCLDGTTVDEQAWAKESDAMYDESPSSAMTFCSSLIVCAVAIAFAMMNL
ncbi:hypothetical protein ACHAXN_004436 [Cyclotella atomus]